MAKLIHDIPAPKRTNEVIERDPFFTNDLYGILKIISLLVGWLVVAGGFIWKFLSEPIMTELRSLKLKINDKETGLSPRVTLLERDVLVFKSDLRGLDESFGDLKSEITEVKHDQKATLDQLNRMHSSIDVLLDRSERRRANDRS